MNWDKKIGPVEFWIAGSRNGRDQRNGKKNQNRHEKLDSYRAHILKMFEEDKFIPGTSFLKKGKKARGFRLVVPYSRPANPAKGLDPKKVMEVCFDPDNPERFFKLSFAEREGMTVRDVKYGDMFSVVGVVQLVDRWRARHEYFDAARRSCGSPRRLRRGCGHQKGYKSNTRKVERNSKKRKNGTQGWNHVWSYRIINANIEHGCGRCRIWDLPKGSEPGRRKEEIADPKIGLLGRPWPWFEFKNILTGKCEDSGIELEFVSSADAVNEIKKIQAGTLDSDESDDKVDGVDVETENEEENII